MIEEIETNIKVSKFKVGDRVRITKYKNTKTWLSEISVIDSVMKTKPWAYKIKYLNGEAIIGNFYEKEMLLSKL